MLARMRSPLALALVASFSLFGCGDDAGEDPFDVTPTDAQIAYCPGDATDALTRAERALRQLTLEQKAALMAGTAPLPMGGSWKTMSISALGIPAYRMIDGPRGASLVAGHATPFPVAAARGATFDPELERRVGAAIARETRGLGANVLLAPTVNVLRHPRWGRAQETYGADPLHIALFGAAFVEGVQAEGIVSTVKHYALNSIENGRLSIDVLADARTMREIYLPPFERIVKEAKVATVMTAYNSVNGSFASENAELLSILYDDWGFAGFTMSDWMYGTHDTVKAVHAGLDLEMPNPKIYGPALAAAVQAGEVDEALLDRSVRRLLFTAFCYDVGSIEGDRSLVETDEARALALEVAQRSLVLLQNEGGALPLSDEEGFSIAVLGRLADAENIGDTGSSHVNPSPGTVVTPYQGLVARAGSNPVELLEASDPELAEKLASFDAVVLVVGYTAEDEGEGEGSFGAGDRASLSLRDEDLALIEAVAPLHERVILVIEGGSAVVLTDVVEHVEAIVMAWYPGVEGGTAIADLLFGDVNFSGRLPTSFPADEAHLPPFENDVASTTYGYFHDYRHLDAEGLDPLFPFGYGLSYVEVSYSAIRLSKDTARAGDVIDVEVDVTNEGDRSVLETVQVYVRPPGEVVSRPVRDLRAFGQVELGAGETKTVTLSIRVDELGYWDEAAGAFVLEPGVHLVEAGRHARDLPQYTELLLEL